MHHGWFIRVLVVIRLANICAQMRRKKFRVRPPTQFFRGGTESGGSTLCKAIAAGASVNSRVRFQYILAVFRAPCYFSKKKPRKAAS